VRRASRSRRDLVKRRGAKIEADMFAPWCERPAGGGIPDPVHDSGHGEMTMNTDQVAGKWDVLKGKAKRIWGELTDDDFTKAEGSADKLYGVIQQRFGDAKDAIQRKLDETHLP
jgi:uncharacterized protein YjbJ (UPF0337 family)